jgi:signal transduction histidine kinase
VLASSLDYQETLSSIARLVVRSISDLCIIDLLDEDEKLVQVTAVHTDDGKQAAALALAGIRLHRGQRFLASEAIEHGRLLGALVLGTSRWSRRFAARDLGLAARDEVLGIVAHDLRNPLQSIRLASQLLGAQLADHGDDGRGQKSVETIERSCGRAERLLRDLLDVTRSEAGHLALDRQPLSARQLVMDGVEAQQLLAASAELQLRLDVAADLPRVLGDRDRLLQVLENLIGNAVKFTPPRGQVTVGAAEVGDAVHFWVADTGTGIDADNLPHVFDRFWQAGRTERRGAGLGLAVCQGIVLAHLGRIWVDSTKGTGTIVHFTVPLALPATEQPAPTLH